MNEKQELVATTIKAKAEEILEKFQKKRSWQ